eukprot:IDg6255t1
MVTKVELLPKSGDVLTSHLDSKRWNNVTLRDGDIFLGTYAKAGTTWMQQILRHLIEGIPEEADTRMLSPWVDCRFEPMFFVSALEKQTHRRFMKHHLPQGNLPTEARDKACFIYIIRDGRDVAWSLYNHHRGLTEGAYKGVNSGVYDGPPMPVFDKEGLNEVDYFQRWLEHDGYPLWPFWEHIRSWWRVRNNSRVLMVHFNNLKKDLTSEIIRIYRFLKMHGEVKAGTEEEVVRTAAERSTFKFMKENADRMMPGADRAWKGGAQTFINKGTNGRWVDFLPKELSDKYEETAKSELGGECAHWLATGELPTQ